MADIQSIGPEKKIIFGTDAERTGRYTTDPPPVGTYFWVNSGATNLGKVFLWDASSWLGPYTAAQVGIGDGNDISVVQDYRGVYPASYYLFVSGTAGTLDNDVVYTSDDLSTYNTHLIECSTATGAVDIQVSLDGTNFNVTPAAVLLHDDVTTGGGIKVISIAAGKIGILKGKYKKIKVLQNGALASNARIAHAWE